MNMEWIDVNKRLPAIGQFVVTLRLSAGEIDWDTDPPVGSLGSCWYWGAPWGNLSHPPVPDHPTHWCSVPALPAYDVSCQDGCRGPFLTRTTPITASEAKIYRHCQSCGAIEVTKYFGRLRFDGKPL
jgi:hypothetical protein